MPQPIRSPKPSPPRLRALALALSGVLHLAAALAFTWRPETEPAARAQSIEIEVLTATTPPAEPAPQPSASPAAPAVPSRQAPTLRRRTEAARASQEAQASSHPVGLPADKAATSPDSAADSTTGATGLPVDAPVAAGGPSALSLELSGRALSHFAEPPAGRDGSRREPPVSAEREAEVVKGRIDSMLAEAQSELRGATAVDGNVQGLGRGFERAARRGELDGDQRTWVEGALAGYGERLTRYGRRGAPEPEGSAGAWDRMERRAMAGLQRDGESYLAVVELRQAHDGSLLALRLVESSGAREFDERALGSVVAGLFAGARAPRPGRGDAADGTLSLWALEGDRLPASEAVQAAKKAYRYALLDVVDLKPTVVELRRGGQLERLEFTARLLAIF